ncbi:unnamed protein product [Vitrella brassicaformis CCMP3155]|uniref:Glutamine-dependent NAD(+) synthetase n=2 Tax=Vitrella brassicaformis TaxID=1169539 RepID=A0A0G4FD21_VITBC|nr:unnamed protein product [Vitrella brassicaformis CCMP3155]|eukprot:CEM11116.1 unnamed protein product [Vitrella brassicaformis CCMP3155]
MRIATVATCNLNQWALDFEGNLFRTEASIRGAKERRAKLRIGPELELCGYGCEDHFLENDTFQHSWESMARILKTDLTHGILCDIGAPVMHKSVRYNCRIFCLDGKILMIRPKLLFANDGNYREFRFFAPWMKGNILEDFYLPLNVAQVTGQQKVPFGIGVIDCRDTSVASETCEELWTPHSPHIPLFLDGVEIIGNGSGSHHQLRKLDTRIDLILSATSKSGGVYLYANQQGCDGNRLYYDGCALIAVNGQVVQQASQFAVNDVEVITARVDLDEVRSYRAAVSSRSVQAAGLKQAFPRVFADIQLTSPPTHLDAYVAPTPPRAPVYRTPMEEIAEGPACWLWDYLRRSGARGFFVPLSGGADSASVAAIVGSMCQIVMRKCIDDRSEEVIGQVEQVLHCKHPDSFPRSHQELAHQLLHTTYMGTVNSSQKTHGLAKALAEEIGAYHMDATIDPITKALEAVFKTVTGKTLRFACDGGSPGEDLALQNIQARTRMVLAYMLAALLPWVRGFKGWLLVLATGNVDEGLRGYLTKYDCSSGDINPIGAISKVDLKEFLYWAADNLNYPALKEVVAAPPTAELRPIGDASLENHTQQDEVDMGMTYEELGWFGRLRKLQRCGPVSMFRQLMHHWTQHSPRVTAEKVKRFFVKYAENRHKMTTLTPAYHAESYSPDDNRFDHRPFLYNTKFDRQFDTIDEIVRLLEDKKDEEEGET